MADKKISDFTAATTLASGDLLEIETAGGNSRKMTAANARTYFKQGFRGALVKKASNLTGQNVTTQTAVTFDTDVYDTDGFHDTGSNTERLTVPSGVSYARLSYCITIANHTNDQWVSTSIQKSTGGGAASSDWDGTARQNVETGGGTVSISSVTPVVPVTAGDYFQLMIQVEADTSIDFTAARTWFAIEVIE